jgi:hypothetical protein
MSTEKKFPLFTILLIILLFVVSLVVSLFPTPSLAQGGRTDNVVWRAGMGIGGVNVAVCQPLATTAASVTANLATFTMASNPQTAGFAIGGQILVAGFTGGDTYYNAGTISSSFQITGGLTVLSVTSTQIVAALTHANASAGTNGTILQMGNSTTSCGGLATLYTDSTLGTPSLINPVVSDGYGNYGFWATPGQYYIQYYGPTVTTTIRPITVPGTGGSITGSIGANQVAFGSASNTITGSASFQWGSPVVGALNLNTSSSSCPTPAACTLISLTNSGGGTTPFYIYKNSDNSICIQNDSASIATHGLFCFTANGTAQLLSGANGPQVQLITSIVGPFPAGSVTWQLPDTGVGNAVFALNTPGNASESAYTWDTGTGCTRLYPINSSTIFTASCPPVAGVVNTVWGTQCGTIAAGGACSNATTASEHCISGVATLSGGTSTITGISPAFTNATSFIVLTSDTTTPGNANHGAGASGSTITFTGTGTDNIQFIACGG